MRKNHRSLKSNGVCEKLNTYFIRTTAAKQIIKVMSHLEKFAGKRLQLLKIESFFRV